VADNELRPGEGPCARCGKAVGLDALAYHYRGRWYCATCLDALLVADAMRWELDLEANGG